MNVILGLALGISGVVLGHIFEGGHFSSLVQFTAAFIVFGGTFGAVLVSNSLDDIKLGLSLFKGTIKGENKTLREQASEDIIRAAKLARKESILKVETMISQFQNPFMHDVFRYMIDGVGVDNLKALFEARIDNEESKKILGSKVWEDAGGYAPTIGIIGAVLGLIHVMGNITNTSALGQGIAVAFVATIYGVASANLIFLPLATRIKRMAEYESATKEMILDGAISILDGLNPYLIEEKLATYTGKDTSGISGLE